MKAIHGVGVVWLVLAGCGGSEFSTGFAGDDGGGDVQTSSPEASAADDGPIAEASASDREDAVPGPAAQETGSTSDAAHDAVADGPTICTALPRTPSNGCPASLSDHIALYSPEGFTYAMWNPLGTDGGGFVGCGATTTPIACTCAETYTCACVLSHVDAPTLCQQGGAVATCEIYNGVPLVICPGASAAVACPSTCGGCCDAHGTCQPGATAAAACGVGGSTCVSCGSSACVNGACH